MKGKELLEVIDFKKWTIVELQMKFEEFKERFPDKKLIFVTQSATIEADIINQMYEEPEEEGVLAVTLREYELNPTMDISDREILNVDACIYLKNVKITPFALPTSPIHLDEFVLFSSHLLGITVSQ